MSTPEEETFVILQLASRLSLRGLQSIRGDLAEMTVVRSQEPAGVDQPLPGCLRDKGVTEMAWSKHLWGVGEPLDLSMMLLRDVGLTCANLRRVNLRDSTVRDASLEGADLTGADLREAEFRGVDWRGVKGVICHIIKVDGGEEQACAFRNRGNRTLVLINDWTWKTPQEALEYVSHGAHRHKYTTAIHDLVAAAEEL